MNANMARLLERLETTATPTVTGTLRGVRSDGTVCMCPLGHLVDEYITQTPGAYWASGDRPYRQGSYYDPNMPDMARLELIGYPSDETLAHFGINYKASERIYRQNDHYGKTPAEVAEFIREVILPEPEYRA